jgi:hypothetical protein
MGYILQGTWRGVSSYRKYFEGALLLYNSINTCPTGEQIFRYLDTMTRHVKPGFQGKHGPPSQ